MENYNFQQVRAYWAWKLLTVKIMDTSGHLRVSETAARRPGRPRGRRKKRADSSAPVQRELAAVGTLTRTKSLLLAALRVWELKHRISD
jgi:hypothetical protein